MNILDDDEHIDDPLWGVWEEIVTSTSDDECPNCNVKVANSDENKHYPFCGDKCRRQFFSDELSD